MTTDNLINDDFAELEKQARQEQIKTDIKDARLNKQQEQIQSDEEKAAFDSSPIGLWQAAIRECVPPALSFVPDLAVTDEETEALANGLAPALAKHFPINEAFTLPVEVMALATVYMVFAPKVQLIKAKRAAANLKEVKEDETPTD
jgi:hypothetical protein